jgi:hypothetical protein
MQLFGNIRIFCDVDFNWTPIVKSVLIGRFENTPLTFKNVSIPMLSDSRVAGVTSQPTLEATV